MPNQASLLPGTQNTRDLGGYALPGGGATRSRVLLRSDHLARTGEADAALLAAWDVRLIIDLRREDEVLKNPTSAPLAQRFSILRLPVDNTAFFARRKNDPSFQLWELYESMLAHQGPQFAAAVRQMARVLPHGVLFHCSAGKDRTGLLAALLLGCAGVSPADIVEDYALTERLLYDKPPEEIATIPPDTDPAFYRMLLGSGARHMEKTLQLLEGYGGPRQYLLDAGVPQAELDFVLQCLCGSPA